MPEDKPKEIKAPTPAPTPTPPQPVKPPVTQVNKTSTVEKAESNKPTLVAKLQPKNDTLAEKKINSTEKVQQVPKTNLTLKS